MSNAPQKADFIWHDPLRAYRFSSISQAFASIFKLYTAFGGYSAYLLENSLQVSQLPSQQKIGNSTTFSERAEATQAFPKMVLINKPEDSQNPSLMLQFLRNNWECASSLVYQISNNVHNSLWLVLLRPDQAGFSMLRKLLGYRTREPLYCLKQQQLSEQQEKNRASAESGDPRISTALTLPIGVLIEMQLGVAFGTLFYRFVLPKIWKDIINRVEMNFVTRSLYSSFSKVKKPMRVAVTGAAGQICYSMLFRIANGDMLGPDQPVILHLIDIPQAQKALTGVAMELGDCAFPLLREIVCTDDLKTGFTDVDAALLVGAKPRGKGQERGDLLQENAKIFIPQGRAINDYASREVRTLVVGNPANTNALICATHAKDLPKKNFAAMTRLDHDRAVWQLAEKTGTTVGDIAKVVVWGNHSPTMYPDLCYATVKGQPAVDLVGQDWYHNKFIPRVQKRGAEIIEARGLSSAASAGNAALSHMRSWFLGHTHDWISFGIWSTGNPYNVPDGLFYSFPVTVQNKEWTIVPGLNVTEDQRKRLAFTANELLQERKAIESLLKV